MSRSRSGAERAGAKSEPTSWDKASAGWFAPVVRDETWSSPDIGEDMDGRVLVQAFEESPKITRIPSWEHEPGDCGMHAADLRMDPAATQAVLQQFVALGYIQPPSNEEGKAVEAALREQQYNLARVYLDSRHYAEALPIFEELFKKWPDQTRFAQHLAQCYLALGRRTEAKAILEKLMTISKSEKQTEGDALTEDPASRDTDVPQKAVKPRPWADSLMGMFRGWLSRR